MTLDGIVRWFETLTPESARRAGEVYAPDAHFKDPFNEVRGVEPIARIYAHMFEQVEAPRFEVTGRFPGEGTAMLLWDFTFGPQGARRCVRGASHLVFAADGRIARHRDYWDVAEELYEKVPVLGGLLRLIKRRLRA
ncbi:MAG: nuclear transport factor 2 family protein [Burkholderiales bacterium]|nr:nuclear transport factor 2 family protein [Burkholderiales bacterium]